MEQNPSSWSIGIWNYHLAPSKLKSRIFLCPCACPLCFSEVKYIGMFCIYDHIINFTYFYELLKCHSSSARLRDYIVLHSVNRTFCLQTLICRLVLSATECRGAAEPGSFYLVPGSLHQIFCYISIKNTPNLFDSFYSVFFKVTF